MQLFRKTPRYQSIKLPAFLVLLVGFQGALGMWTVTELVHPGIVSMHLMGGFTTTVLAIMAAVKPERSKPNQPTYFKAAQINTGYLYYSIISSNLFRRLDKYQLCCTILWGILSNLFGGIMARQHGF